MSNELEAARCAIQDALGRVEPCAGDGCPFWHRQSDACALHGTEPELHARPEVAAYLLELRTALDAAAEQS